MAGIKYHEAQDIKFNVKKICFVLGMSHVNLERVYCIRSHESSSRNIIARCHALPKILQQVLEIEPAYVIEILSEKYDKMPEEEQIKTLIHELCLPKEENIVIESNEGITIQPIGDFIDKEFKKSKKINKSNSIEWIIPNEEYRVFSYDFQKEEVKLNQINKLIRRKNKNKTTVEITSRDGRVITTSPEHPVLFTKNLNSYKTPKRKRVVVKNLPAKDILNQKGIPRLLELFLLPQLDREINEVNLAEIIKNNSQYNNLFIEKDYVYKKGVKGIKIPIRFKLDKELGFFFGLYLSEGSIDHKAGSVSFSFNKKEKKYHEFVKKILEKRFGAKPKERKLHKGSCIVVYTYSRLLQEVISDILGFYQKARCKKIPSFVYYSPTEFVAGIVDGWFAGDGYASYNPKIKAVTISAFSKSKELIFGMLLLLAKLGIACRLRRKQQDIRIESFFVPKFYNHCKSLIDSKNMKTKVLSIKKMKHEDRIKHLRFLKIRKVQLKEYRGKYFYNLEVDKNNNFMHASGIFTHNCHIPKTFGGGFRHHDFVNRRTIDKLYKEFKKNEKYFTEQRPVPKPSVTIPEEDDKKSEDFSNQNSLFDFSS
jgi:predicted metallopeptidase